MAEKPDRDQQTEEATPKRRKDSAEKGDVLQSRELGTALVVLAGGAWLALAGGWIMTSMRDMLAQALTFDAGAVTGFDPGAAILTLTAKVVLPLAVLFGLTLVAAIGTPALLGSLGFRAGAFAFKGDKLNPLSGIKRIFGMQGLVELGKSMAKVVLLGAVGVWLVWDRAAGIMRLGAQDVVPAIAELGQMFVFAVLVMGMALALIAGIDVPAQIVQRAGRLRMSKQEVKDEHKQTEGSPEVKGQIRARQHALLRGSARQAVKEATVILVNPEHFAVALRYRPGYDAAPIVVARGVDETAAAIRALARDEKVPVLRYPELTRAIYFTARTGQIIREDLYVAVAAIMAFVFNLDAALAEGVVQPDVSIPPEARFDGDGKPA